MRVTFPIRGAIGALICGMTASACSQSPVGPAPSSMQPAATEMVVPSVASATAQAANVSAEDLATRGWNCQPTPVNPNRVSCSPPNQGHPILLPGPPPSADRPATFTLLVFDTGVFIGTNLLIRSDLYNGQQCRLTGGPYRFIARIGYYECLHPAGD